MDVTDVLRDRMHEPAGLSRMLVVSIAVHSGVVAFMLFAPGGLFRAHDAAPPVVMTISLGGGGSGPSSGGMTSMGGRPVQAEPPVAAKRPEPVRPPAAKTPEMVMPRAEAKPAKPKPTPPTPPVTRAPDEAQGRTPVTGERPSPGSTIADTGARGLGFGLSAGGGPGAGSTLDVGDFCCPEYLVLMTERVKTAWNQNQGVAGHAVVKFTIQRDGRLTDGIVERSSGNAALDLAALRAIVVTRQLLPLPAAFPNQTLTVHLNFDYQR